MLKRHTHNKVTWIDLFQPSQEEVREVMEEFDLHPNVANVLITSRYDTIDPIHKFSKEFEVNSILDKNTKETDTEHVFFLLIKKLYHSINHELEYIEDALENVEARIFQGDEKNMVKDLSFLGRDLLNAKQATNPHKETLESLKEVGVDFFGKNFNKQIGAVINEYRRIRHNIEINKESLNELRETNNSLLSTKENEIMKTLTIMAFVTFPLSLLATVFGMNTTGTPLVGRENHFLMVVGIMLGLATLFFIFFKYKKWL